MTTPKRIQITRSKPWRADNPDAVIVDRRTVWGNPYDVARCVDWWRGWRVGSRFRGYDGVGPVFPTRDAALRDCLRRYRRWLLGRSPALWEQLAGRDLACWCALDQPCHADILLELANGRNEP